MEKKNAMDILFVMKRKKNPGNRRDNAKLRSTNKKPPNDALVFLKDSPNYCVRSAKHEFPGTVGRTCSTEYGTDSCEDLCCGRGFRSLKVTTTDRCRCKFHWCCEIRCHKCTKVEIQHRCKWIRVTWPADEKANLEGWQWYEHKWTCNAMYRRMFFSILGSCRKSTRPSLLSMLVVYRYFIAVAAVKASWVLDKWKRIVSILFTAWKANFKVLRECAQPCHWRSLKFLHVMSLYLLSFSNVYYSNNELPLLPC